MSTMYQEPNQDQITQDVTKEVDAEIKSETSPLVTQVSQTEGNRDRALSEIGEAFGFVVDSSRASAQRLSADYAAGREFESQVFQAANRELAQIRSDAAGEAQRMAQLTGGPVDLASFLRPSLVESGIAQSDFATKMLESSGFGQANVALAESYAGQTFPLMRAREKKQTMQEYNDKIEALQKEIASIKQQRGTRISKAARQRLLEERGYELEKTKAARDWWSQQQGVKIEKDRVKLERDRLKQDDEHFDEELDATKGAKAAEAASANRKEAGKIIDAVTTPGRQEYTQTRKVEAGPGTPGAFQDDTSPTGWSVYKDVKVADVTGVMTRPTQIYDYLMQQGIPSAIAISAVRNWLAGKGVRNARTWVPGQAKEDDTTRGRGKAPNKPEGTRPDSTKGGGKGEGAGGPEDGPTRKRPTGHPKAVWRKGDKGWGWYEPIELATANPATGGVTRKKGWRKVG